MVQAGAQNSRPAEAAPAISFEMADLSWMDKTTGWGTRAKPDFVHGGGLTVAALNIGVYSEIPDRIQYRNRLPRGAYPSPAAGSIGGYYLQEKQEQWADCAAEIY